MIWISDFTGFYVVKNKENALTKRRQVTDIKQNKTLWRFDRDVLTSEKTTIWY